MRTIANHFYRGWAPGVLLVLAAAMPMCSQAGTASRLPLTTVADVPLPGNATRWDYASLDRSGLRWFSFAGAYCKKDHTPVITFAILPAV